MLRRGRIIRGHVERIYRSKAMAKDAHLSLWMSIMNFCYHSLGVANRRLSLGGMAADGAAFFPAR